MPVKTLYPNKDRTRPLTVALTREARKAIEWRTRRVDRRHKRPLSISDYVEEAIRRDNDLEVVS